MSKSASKSTPLNSALAKIPTLSHQLNNLADDAAATVRQVEDFLEKSRVGDVDAHVVFTNGAEHTELLQYGRYAGRFRIVIVTTWRQESPEDEGWESKAFSDCSRDLKLKSFQKLPELVEEIVTKLESLIKQTKETTQIVHETIGVALKTED